MNLADSPEPSIGEPDDLYLPPDQFVLPQPQHGHRDKRRSSLLRSFFHLRKHKHSDHSSTSASEHNVSSDEEDTTVERSGREIPLAESKRPESQPKAQPETVAQEEAAEGARQDEEDRRHRVEVVRSQRGSFKKPTETVYLDEHTEPTVSTSARLSRDKRELVEIRGLPHAMVKYLRFRLPRLLLVMGAGFGIHLAMAFILAGLMHIGMPYTLVDRSGTLPTFRQLVYFFFSVSFTGAADANLIISPTTASTLATLLVTVHIYVGFVLRAIAIVALIYLSSQSPGCLQFSKWAVVTYKSLTGLRSLEFRAINEFGFDRELLDARASVTMTITPIRNPTKRRFYPLKLVRSAQAVMPIMWTVSHIIDPDSPLFGQNSASLEDNRAVFEVLIDFVDPVTRQRVYQRYSYSAATLVFNAEFETVADTSGLPDRAYIDFTKLHRVIQRPQ